MFKAFKYLYDFPIELKTTNVKITTKMWAKTNLRNYSNGTTISKYL